MSINVMLDGTAIPIDRGVFEALFENSPYGGYAAVKKALKSGEMPYGSLVSMARKAEIPYPLFFAPRDVVDEQLRLNNERLLTGFSKRSEFSMNSRNKVDLNEVQLIVKNLQHKQDYLKRDDSLGECPIVRLLKKPGATPKDDAAKLMAVLDLAPTELRGLKNKGEALLHLIDKLEAQQVFVAQSAKNYMPQQMPEGATFSGMTVKDKKVPFIFIASGDEGEKYEPLGRRVFTLTLLAVLIARGRFVTATYNGNTPDKTSEREYAITAEILMPEVDFRKADLSDLDAIQAVSDSFKVTPSAVVMRARRLGLLTKDEAIRYFAELDAAYVANPYLRSARGFKALLKYNGPECSRRMLALYDSRTVNTGEFCRVMFSRKYRNERFISDFRAVVP